MFIFSKTNPIRVAIKNFIDYENIFDNFILVIILVSTLLLAFEKPSLDPEGVTMTRLDTIDFYITIIFTVECVLKIIALGLLFNGENSYLRVMWNVLDIFIVITSIISMMDFTGQDISFIKVLRILRVLRPLKVISKDPGLKIAI